MNDQVHQLQPHNADAAQPQPSLAQLIQIASAKQQQPSIGVDFPRTASDKALLLAG